MKRFATYETSINSIVDANRNPWPLHFLMGIALDLLVCNSQIVPCRRIPVLLPLKPLWLCLQLRTQFSHFSTSKDLPCSLVLKWKRHSRMSYVRQGGNSIVFYLFIPRWKELLQPGVSTKRKRLPSEELLTIKHIFISPWYKECKVSMQVVYVFNFF